MARFDGVSLVCADAEAPNCVPGSVFDRVCSTCGRKLMVAPSGQELLKARPDMVTVCAKCAAPKLLDPATEVELAADADVVVDEVRRSGPNLRRSRN